MSSDEQKKQLLAQKLFRSLKSKQKSSNSDQKTVSAKKPKISTTKTGSQSKESEANLTK